MSEQDTPAATDFRIHPDTRPGLVHLTVSNLAAQMAFYTEALGLKQHWREGKSAGVGAGGPDLLRFTELSHASRVKGTAGLYHFAVLLPDRRELARAIKRLLERGIQNYPTDHIMTKTTYLEDPEKNQIELYTESPEDGTMGIIDGEFKARRSDGTLSEGREPLDVDALFSELPPGDPVNQPMPPETRIGHVHLHVADLDQTMQFYHSVLGFDNMGIDNKFRMGMVSAGGYHHHIGFNTWMGEGAVPQPEGSLGLRHINFLMPTRSALYAVIAHVKSAGVRTYTVEGETALDDPSGNTIVLTIAQQAAD